MQATISANESAVRSRAGEPCRRRVRAETLRAFAIGPDILFENRQTRSVYLIRLFCARATFLLAAASTLRIARMTRNALFCHTAM